MGLTGNEMTTLTCETSPLYTAFLGEGRAVERTLIGGALAAELLAQQLRKGLVHKVSISHPCSAQKTPAWGSVRGPLSYSPFSDHERTVSKSTHSTVARASIRNRPCARCYAAGAGA